MKNTKMVEPVAASVKKVFLKISLNSQENTLCQSLIFNKVAGLSLQLYKKGDSGTVVFLWILRNF